MLKLLAEYRERKKEMLIFQEQDERIDFLERCLANVEEFERDIIEKTCIDGISIRSYAKRSGFSRETVTKERKRIVNMLCKFMNRKERT